MERLEDYFPYDPYTLRYSRRYIQPLYTAWQVTSDAGSGGSDSPVDGDSPESEDERPDDNDEDDFLPLCPPTMTPDQNIFLGPSPRSLPDAKRSKVF